MAVLSTLNSIMDSWCGLARDIILSEPTLKAQVGGALLHMAFWAYFSNMDSGGAMGRIERWIKRQAWYPVVQKNYKDDPVQEMCPLSDPGDNFVGLVKTALHHSWGGLLMLFGMISQKPWLWRHGMLTEVGGLDLLELLQVTYCKLRPPGCRPVCDFLKSNAYIPFVSFHHSVGLAVGLPVNMYFADRFQFQLFGIVLLGAPAVTCLTSVLCQTYDLELHRRLKTFDSIQSTLGFCVVQRTLYFFPAAYSCMKMVWAQERSWTVRAAFVYGLASMSIFNLMVLGFRGYELKKSVSAKHAKEEACVGAGEFEKDVSAIRPTRSVHVAGRMVASPQRMNRGVTSRKHC